MAYIIKLGVQYINFINEYGDSRVENWFLFSSIFPPLMSLLFYYYVIFNALPNIMKNRPAYTLRDSLIIYNGIQVIACIYVVYECCKVINFNLITNNCQNIDYSENGLKALTICYTYCLIKAFDLCDTIFFVLRKKDNQITFLHLYHHGGMCLMTWAITKFYGGGSILFIPFLNSIVHIFMYTYYLLSVYMRGNKKILWLKKHITQLQLVQFVTLLLLIVRVVFAENCNIPKWTAMTLFVQNLFMISLFLDFYLKTYVYKKKAPVPNLNKDIQAQLLKSLEMNAYGKHEKRI